MFIFLLVALILFSMGNWQVREPLSLPPAAFFQLQGHREFSGREPISIAKATLTSISTTATTTTKIQIIIFYL